MTKNHREVLKALAIIDHPVTDAALVPSMQHAFGSRQSSSGIRSRRKELTARRTPFVEQAGTVIMPSGRSAKLWQITSAGRVYLAATRQRISA